MTKKAVKVSSEVTNYAAEVAASQQAIMTLLNSVYPPAADGSLSYARTRFIENLVWRSDKDAEFQTTKAAEAQQKLDDAHFIQRAIDEQQKREEITDPHKVYSTQVERAERWNERMQLQLHGARIFQDAAHAALEALASE